MQLGICKCPNNECEGVLKHETRAFKGNPRPIAHPAKPSDRPQLLDHGPGDDGVTYVICSSCEERFALRLP